MFNAFAESKHHLYQPLETTSPLITEIDSPVIEK